MEKTRKMILESRFQKAIQINKKYIAVAIAFEDREESEIIVNTRKSFESKLRYYLSSYNDDLELKTCEEIRIRSCVSFDGEKTLNEVAALLEEFEI